MKAKNNEAVEKAIIITSCILCGLFFLYGIYKTVEEVIRGKYEPELIEKLNTPTQKEINKTEKEIIQITEELRFKIYEANNENDSAVISRFYQLAGGSPANSSTGE